LLTVAGYVVADILPSSTSFVHDIFEAVVQFARDSDDDKPGNRGIEGWWNSVLEHPKNVWKPLASSSPSVQRAAGAAMGVIASRLLRPIVPATVRLATAVFVAGHVNVALYIGFGERWYENTTNSNVDRWLRCLDVSLYRWCRCVWSAILHPAATYTRVRHSVDSLLRRELAVPPHVANGMIGGAVVGLIMGA
jgi:hypothetical protein